MPGSEPGTLTLFGDSITCSRAFETPLADAPQNLPGSVATSLAVVQGHMLEDGQARWRGPADGNVSGRTIAWVEQNVGTWLRQLNPEVAVQMFGTNDLGSFGRKSSTAAPVLSFASVWAPARW